MFGHSVWRTVGSFWLSSCEFGFCSKSARLKVAFTILNVRRPILSVGSLLKHGHGVIFDRENQYLLLRDESTNAVHRVPVEARGNTFVVLGRSVSSMLAPVVKERVAVPVMPAVPVLPSGPHEDRAVLEQALDDQPMELAEEGARGFANPNRLDEETVERHNLTHLPAAAGATFVYGPVEEMLLIRKLQLPRLMQFVL